MVCSMVIVSGMDDNRIMIHSIMVASGMDDNRIMTQAIGRLWNGLLYN